MVALNVSTLKAFHHLAQSTRSAFGNGFFLFFPHPTSAASVCDQVGLRPVLLKTLHLPELPVNMSKFIGFITISVVQFAIFSKHASGK